MEQYLQNKKGLVENVFNKVYDQYDLMNDLMSLGIHRLWKKNLLNMMNPSSNHNGHRLGRIHPLLVLFYFEDIVA